MDHVTMSAVRYFTGERVSLVAFEREDVDLVRRWINDEEITHFFGSRFPVSVFEQTQWYEHVQRDATKKKLLVCNEKKEKVGMVSLIRIDQKNRNCEIGVYIDPAHQHKGYAREALTLLMRFAFRELNMHKIYANVLAFNPSSIALFRSL